MSTRLIRCHEKPAVSRDWFKDIITTLNENYPSFKADILEVTGSKPLDAPEKSEVVQMLTQDAEEKTNGRALLY